MTIHLDTNYSEQLASFVASHPSASSTTLLVGRGFSTRHRRAARRRGRLASESRHCQHDVTLGSAAERDTNFFSGRVDKHYGADMPLRAFGALLRQQPKLKPVSGAPTASLLQPEGTRVGFEAFCAAVFSVVLRGQVQFRGRVPNEEFAALRTRATRTFVASRWQNRGYTAFEPLGHGCPLLCSRSGGSPGTVINNQTGLLALSEDAADFAAEIAAMLDDPVVAARQHVIENHSAVKAASDSLAHRERVIAEHRGAPLALT